MTIRYSLDNSLSKRDIKERLKDADNAMKAAKELDLTYTYAHDGNGNIVHLYIRAFNGRRTVALNLPDYQNAEEYDGWYNRQLSKVYKADEIIMGVNKARSVGWWVKTLDKLL